MRIADAPSAVPHESLNRSTPDYATPEALQSQREAFRAKGGVVQQIATGVMASGYPGYKSTVRQSDPALRNKKIRMEDGL